MPANTYLSITSEGLHIIYSEGTTIEVLDTETGIVRSRWGMRCEPSPTFASYVKAPWNSWLSFLSSSITPPSIEFFKEWKRWAQAGRIIRMRGISMSLENSNPYFAGINLTLLRNYEIEHIPVGTYDLDDFYDACKSEFYGQSFATLSNSQSILFQRVYGFFEPDVVRPLAALIEREEMTRFWMDNAAELRGYIETKMRLGEPLSAVRNSWDDFCATLQKVVLTNNEICDIMRAQIEREGK